MCALQKRRSIKVKHSIGNLLRKRKKLHAAHLCAVVMRNCLSLGVGIRSVGALHTRKLLIIIVTLDQLFYSNFYALILSLAVRAIKAAGLISPVAHFLRCIRKK
jgi:hypothetical protein